jgi:hypothetical protein
MGFLGTLLLRYILLLVENDQKHIELSTERFSGQLYPGTRHPTFQYCLGPASHSQSFACYDFWISLAYFITASSALPFKSTDAQTKRFAVNASGPSMNTSTGGLLGILRDFELDFSAAYTYHER